MKSPEKDSGCNRTENLLESQQQQSGLNNNFSIFNFNKSERGSHLKGENTTKLKRTGRKVRPPPFKFKSINQYFKENPRRDLGTSSERPNDPED